jgi:hypothetical protein
MHCDLVLGGSAIEEDMELRDSLFLDAGSRVVNNVATGEIRGRDIAIGWLLAFEMASEHLVEYGGALRHLLHNTTGMDAYLNVS